MAWRNLYLYPVHYLVQLYRKLPLPLWLRYRIKDFLFTRSSFLFHKFNAYRNWLAEQHIHPAEPLPHHNAPPVPAPKAPAESRWDALVRPPSAETPVVDVIIPAYDGYDETLACIYSVLTSENSTPYALTVIYDAGPNQQLEDKLRLLADKGLFTLLFNRQNLGFVKTVNRGMRLHTDRDVVLLNADTEVYNNWLDRLRGHAERDETVSSVTPFSNNAEICSYPFFCQNNPMELECSYAELDLLAATANTARSVELPTAIGFCMYIVRKSLDEIGYFDAKTFGKGYGEENDFCLRASAKGWKHLLAGDVFVRHVGGVSFSNRKQRAIQRALVLISQRYPDYLKTIERFIEKDTPRLLRRRIDMARLQKDAPRAILFITHNLGGGTERHVRDLETILKRYDTPCYYLRPDARKGTVELSHPELSFTPNLCFDTFRETDALMEAIRALNIVHFHVHHIIGFDNTMREMIAWLSRTMHIPFDITLHDFFTICPRVHLTTGTHEYCGEPPVSECQTCITTYGSPVGEVYMGSWREEFAALLKQARRVIVPSDDTATRLGTYFPDTNFVILPHPEDKPNFTTRPAATKTASDPLNIALIGAIGEHKGAYLLRDCAADAAKRNLPLIFTVIGHCSLEASIRHHKNIHITGPYEEAEIYDRIKEAGCHAALFSSVAPETYSYTLSIAFNAGLFPIAFDIGAIAERIRAAGWGKILPFSHIKKPAAVNDALLALNLTPPPHSLPVYTQQERYPDFLEDYYGFTWGTQSAMAEKTGTYS